MATIKAVLKREARKTDNTHLLMLRVTRFGRAVYMGTQIYIPKAHWNESGNLEKANWVLKKNPLHEAYNLSIKQEWQAFDRFQLDRPDLTAVQLKAQYGRESDDLMPFFRVAVVEIKKELTANTARTYDTAMLLLEGFTNGRLSHLDLPFLKAYEKHLLVGRKRNTVNLMLSKLKTLTRRAMEAGLLEENPFRKFQMKRAKVKKEPLSPQELARIISYKTKGGPELARKVFLLQFFLQGMRVSDILLLRWEQLQPFQVEYVEGGQAKTRTEYRLFYKSQKTHSLLSILVPQPALLYLGEPQEKGYVFPYVPEGLEGEPLRKRMAVGNTLINQGLKKIAEALEIEKHLSSHVARHSFASIAWANSRDIKAVSEALGHRSVSMTENYLRGMTYQEHDALLEQAFRDFI